MKIGTLTFKEATEKMYKAHSVFCDQLGEFVYLYLSKNFDTIKIGDQFCPDNKYELVKSQNENVDVFVTSNSNKHNQYMRLFTEDGDEMDFILFEPAPIMTLDSILHPTH